MKTLLRGLIALVLFVGSLAGGALVVRQSASTMLWGPGPAASATTLVIPRGSRTAEIGRLLEQAQIVRHWWFFEAAVQFLDTGGPLHAGEYAFLPGQSLHDVLRQLREGRTVVHRLTLPEGLSVAEILTLVESESALSGPLPAKPPEGSLMPDTYNFSRGDSRADLVARMRRAMDHALADAWAKRTIDPRVPTQSAALVLASIVEKESALPDERPKVAAVFLNRLAKGMKLQADPTVIYALTEGKGSLGRPLGHGDLAVESPYNSYLHEGLPPTPIACPGRASIQAVLHPDSTDALYFVADGSGRHVFSGTLDQHNHNVAKLRQVERANGQAGSAN